MGKTKFKPVEDVNPEVVEEVEKVEELEEQRSVGEEEDVTKSFEELGLDSRLIRALSKKGIEKPTLIQHSAIPYILEGKDRAKTGSGKTLAYLLPLLQKLFLSDSASKKKLAPSAFILVPSRELCQQVYTEVFSLIELCRVQLKAVQLTSSMTASDMRNVLAGLPEILVTTPACIPKCFAAGVLEPSAISDSLEILVLDEADLLLSYGYEDNLRSVTSIIPRRCQCLLMSATTSSDVEKLKKLILHNPIVLTLTEDNDKEEPVPSNVQQFWISCSAQDKLLHILALLKLEVVQKKVLIFINTIDMGFKLKLFLEKFGIKSAILNGELPQNSRLHILEQFNAGLFDYLIATDDNSQTKKEKEEAKGEDNKENNKNKKRGKPKLDAEFGVVRGIDFKKVHTIDRQKDVSHEEKTLNDLEKSDGSHFPGDDYRPSDRKNWMAGLTLEKLTLNKIVWPGTHDSATNDIGIPLISRPLAECQTLSIYEQLVLGTRVLDIRIQEDRQICHGILTSYDVDVVIDDVIRFLSETHSEIIILEIRTEFGHKDPPEFETYLADKLGQFLIHQDVNLFDKPVSEILPKRVICIWKQREAPKPSRGGHLWNSDYLKDNWIDTDLPWTKFQSNLKHLSEQKPISSRKIFYRVENTVTPQADNPVVWVKPVTDRIRKHARLFISQCVSKGCGDKLQILSTDFIEEDFVDACVGLIHARIEGLV